MRDMPVPPPAPLPVDHGQHDPLLIAQIAAGDPLAIEQQHEAALLVAQCAACASLAADLRAISSAVAWEPLPPRRRDFRIDPERAARLRGSPWQRFLRRLSVPQAGALRPAAAGILSVGLLFMVAGAVWPGDGPAVVPAEPAPSPALMMQMQAPAMASSGAPIDAAAAAPPSAAVPPAPERNAAEVEAFSAADAQAEERAVADPADTDPAAAGLAAEEVGAEVPADGVSADAVPVTEVPAAADSLARDVPGDDLAASQDDETLQAKALVVEPGTGAADAGLPLAGAAAPSEAQAADAALEALAVEEAATRGATPAGAGSAELDAGGSRSLESVLVGLGGLLAVIGAILLLLTWLSRRAADPLLR